MTLEERINGFDLWRFVAALTLFALAATAGVSCQSIPASPASPASRSDRSGSSSHPDSAELRQNETPRFNVVMIVADSLRWDVLSFHGGSASTPNLAWLVKHGALFENAYSTAPWTMDSSLSMLTGTYADVFALAQERPPHRSFRVPDGHVMLAEILVAADYTAQFYTENSLLTQSNRLQGFEVFSQPKNRDSVDEIVDAIGQLGEDQNFYLVKWIMDPHWPYLPEPRFRPRKPSSLDLKMEFYSQFRHLVDSQPPPERLQFTKDLYAGEVASVDARVGLILDALRSKGLLENTFVIFTSDHGDEFLDHGGWGHGSSYYEELVHVPLIIMGPDIEGGSVIEQRLSHIDLMPTLYELLQLEHEGDFRGASYAPLLFGAERELDRIIYLSGEHIGRRDVSDALVYGNHKLLLSRDSTRATLYNLESDPNETIDISGEETSLTLQLDRKLRAIRRENGAQRDRIEKERNGDKASIEREREETERALRALGYIE